MARIWQLWRERPRGETPAQAQQRELSERALLSDDYRHVFASEPGQRVLADILRRAGVMQDCFDAHPPIAAYNEGKRRMGLEIIEMINADPADQEHLARSGNTESLFHDRPTD